MKNLLLYLLLFTSFNLTAQTNNYSLEFDGVDDYVEIPDHSSLDFNQGDFTIFSWVQFNSLVEAGIFDHLPNSYPDRCNFRLNASNQLHLSIKDNNHNEFTASSDTAIPDFNWHFLAVTFSYNTESVSFYLDGQYVSETISQSGLNTGINPDGIVQIAKYGTPSFANCAINYVAVWNVALDSTQIQQYMQCPPTGSEPGLVGFWNFEEGTGTTAADQTSNANDGTLNGGVTWSVDVPAYNCNTSIGALNNSLVKLFPNPSNDIINLTLAQHSNAQIILTDILGKEVLSKSFTSNEVQLNLKCLESKGTYFAKVLDIDGNVIAIKKLIYQ